MIVNNLNARRPFLRPDKTHSILIIHAEAVLSLSSALQRFQMIPRRHSQEVKCGRGVQLIQFPSSHGFDVHEVSYTVSSEQGLSLGAAEGQDQGAGTISQSDISASSTKCVMRITGDDSEGFDQLSNFIDPELKHPVIVTTSRHRHCEPLTSFGLDDWKKPSAVIARP